MITLERKTEIQKRIANYLLDKEHNNMVILHVIPEGLGSLSVIRYLRAMRQQGLIEYEDPRKHKHYYFIFITPKLRKWINSNKKDNKKKN